MNLQEEFFMIPPVTRVYISSYTIVTILVQLDLLSPFQLYFNPYLTFNRFQLWRIVTNFFGPFGFVSLFNILFAYRYSRMLEENSFRGRTADLCFMFLFGAACMILVGLFINMVFLGPAFMIMVVYIWSRRNPYVRMNFFGLINFDAPYLPWVLLAFSFLLGNSITVDIMGIAVGHIYFFLEDVFPQQPNGFRILKTPSVLKYIVEGAPVEPQEMVQLPEEERPGGMNWGGEE